MQEVEEGTKMDNDGETKEKERKREGRRIIKKNINVIRER